MSGRHAGAGRQGEQGMTLVELLIVVAIVGILVNATIPAVTYALWKARATSIVEQMKVIEVAVLQYHTDTGKWPADTQPGQLPPELAGYLKKQINFAPPRFNYKLDYENWMATAAGGCRYPTTGTAIGISVTTTDARLLAMLARVAPSMLKYSINQNYTYTIDPCGK